MINSYAVEIFPNLFSVTFVNLKDYLATFKDCVDDKGKPVYRVLTGLFFYK